MEKVTLLFESREDQKRFYNTLVSDYIEMNSRSLTIVCQCSQKDVDIAIKNFGAKLVERDKK